MGDTLSQYLDPLASWFRSLGIPSVIVRWGHPVMMATVILAMGSAVAYTGWTSRLTTDGEVSAKNRASHRKIAPWMFLFITLGYTGGILSLVMQNHPILESPHFWTGSLAVFFLGLNGLIAFVGFGGEQKSTLRTVHAFSGAGVMILLVVHGILGLKLGLSL